MNESVNEYKYSYINNRMHYSEKIFKYKELLDERYIRNV